MLYIGLCAYNGEMDVPRVSEDLAALKDVIREDNEGYMFDDEHPDNQGVIWDEFGYRRLQLVTSQGKNAWEAVPHPSAWPHKPVAAVPITCQNPR